MTQEDKDLLFKDLCARLNTNLVCSIYRTDDYGVGYRDEILRGYCKGDIWYEFYFGDDCGIGIDNVSKIKPYLFPMSSMTEEQKKELLELAGYEARCEESCGYDSWGFYVNIVGEYEYEYEDNQESIILYPDDIGIDWLNENMFDWRGLIPKGLANDATGKNIY